MHRHRALRHSGEVSLVLVGAEEHTDQAWLYITDRHSEREVEGGTGQFHCKEDGGCIIQIFCHLFSSVISGEVKSRSETFTPCT